MMAPNSDDTSRTATLQWDEESLAKEKQRPPLYNPEDYATSVKKWARKHISGNPNIYMNATVSELECPRLQNNSLTDYRNPMVTPAGCEMSLRQFGTVSELLAKLKGDLRLSYPSFVQEFVSDPHDGITLLLELLRTIQLSQGSTTSSNGSANTIGRIPPSVQRRALLDELTCLQCLLCCCIRYPESVRRLASSTAGLFALSVCIMSNVNKSRLIALQLLTKGCQPVGIGHTAVSEAMSTLRLRFGEPVRFRFLIGMLTSAGGQSEILAYGLHFINTFLDSADSTQTRLYIQAELKQAGFDIAVIKKIVLINSPSATMVFEELDHWEKNHIDLEALVGRAENAEKQNSYLKDKLLLLERRIQILQEEKGVLISLEQCLKDRCSELQDEVESLKSVKSPECRTTYSKENGSVPAEDEGISSSERSLSPEDIVISAPSTYEIYGIQPAVVPNNTKTDETLNGVVEELKKITSDSNVFNKKVGLCTKNNVTQENTTNASKIRMRVNCNVSMDDPIFDSENEIVPCNLNPQPPRRTRSLVHLYIPSEDYDYNNKEIFFENETPFSSEEGSDSLLSASRCRFPKIGNNQQSNSIMNIVPSSSAPHGNKLNHPFMNNNINGLYMSNYESNDPDIPASFTEHNPQKLKSKSLDRINEGLDTMVDIVLTNYKADAIHLRPQSDSGNMTDTSFSQSTWNAFSNRKGFKISKLPHRYDDKSKIFLPFEQIHSRENENYYFPRVLEKCNSNSFLIKRGHTNAGLYSGAQVTRRYSTSSQIIDLPYMNNKHNNLDHLGKVTDLPSGLY